MKIVNRTRYRTDHLRAFALRVAQTELDSTVGFTMEVTYNRGGTRHTGTSGWAPYHGRKIRVMVPSGAVDRIDLAHTIAHEMAHTRGVRHAAMRGAPRYRRVGTWRACYAWAEALPLDPTPAAPRLSPEARRAEKLATARTRLTAWEAQARHAERFRKKWARAVRRLEVAAAKAALGPAK